MNNEKAKEIIKIAKHCVEKSKPHCVDCIKGEEKDVVLTCRSLVKELLILINDLESENKRIKQSAKNLVFVNEKVVEENQQLKDRIAELEEGIAKSILGCEFLPECTNNKLKQFAERLKEKFNRQEKRFATDVTRFENDLDQVKESDLPTAKHLIGKATGQATMAEKAQHYIDETLKEFDNGK